MSERGQHRRSDALDALVRAGLELIDEQGAAAVTNQKLGERTHYSASTVGYHTRPLHEFVDLLWKHLGSDLAERVFGRPATFDEWADDLLQWTQGHPRSADFFVTHTPIQPSHTRVAYWSFLGGIPSDRTADTATISVLQLLSRRLQAALAYAMNSSAEPGRRRELLAGELRSMARDWRRHQNEP